MKLSIIIPCYNEEEVLNLLFERLEKVLPSLAIDDYEVIFINDGSTDKTATIIKGLIEKNNKYKALQFSRNFGYQPAVLAGLRNCSGDAATIIDADLQDPPELLNKFIEKYNQGYEVVYGVRKKRKGNVVKRFSYFVFYRLFRFLSEIDMPVDYGDYGIISRRVIDIIINLKERGKFIRGLKRWVGFKQAGIEYSRDIRQAGKPKFNLRKLIRFANDGLFSFSKVPLKIAFWVGLLICLGCIFIGFLTIILFFIFDYHSVFPGYTSIFLLISFLGGIQLFFLGLIGEYIGRIYDGVNFRPEYIIESKDNFNK